jgi:hypothetical protein
VLELFILLLAGLTLIMLSIGISLLAHRRRLRELYLSFPVVVPGWGMHMEPIPFKAEPRDFARMLELLTKHAVEKKGYSRRRCAGAFKHVIVDFVHYDKSVEEETGGKANRHIRGTQGFTAGDLKNGRMRVIYRPDDTLDMTEFDHECCHQLQDVVEHLYDHKHEDRSMWDDVEQPANREFRGEG